MKAGLICLFIASAVGAAEQQSTMPLAAVRTWAYQLQGLDEAGAVDALAASRYDLLVVEPTCTERDSTFDAVAMVRRLHYAPHRKLVLAYLSLGEAEDWRAYWQWSKWRKNRPHPPDLPAFIIRPDPDGWSGCFPVAFWEPAWKDILSGVMEKIVASGFDGVYLDWVEAYDEPAVKRAAKVAGIDPAREMINLLGEVRAHGRQQNPNFIVIQQNAAALLEGRPELLKVVDGIGQEDLWYSGVADSDWDDPRGHDQRTPVADTREEIRLLKQFRAAGKPVFTIDYTVQNAPETYRRARVEGFVPYCTRVSLSRLSTTPPAPVLDHAPTNTGRIFILKSSGICDGCAEAISKMLFTAGIQSQILGVEQLQSTVSPHDTVVVGGSDPAGEGEWTIKQDLVKAKAFDWLKQHIANGGKYVGICAGAYLAEKWIDQQNREHGLDIFPGKIENYSRKKAATFLPIHWDEPTTSRWVFCQDGPAFYPDDGANVVVVARFAADHVPAAIVFQHGKGWVGLLSPHLEADAEWAKESKVPDKDGLDYDLGVAFFHRVLELPSK